MRLIPGPEQQVAVTPAFRLSQTIAFGTPPIALNALMCKPYPVGQPLRPTSRGKGVCCSWVNYPNQIGTSTPLGACGGRVAARCAGAATGNAGDRVLNQEARRRRIQLATYRSKLQITLVLPHYCAHFELFARVN
jgi:hypothetical protein